MTKYFIIKVGNLYLEHSWGSFGISIGLKEKAKRFTTEELKDIIEYLNDNDIQFKIVEVVITEVENN